MRDEDLGQLRLKLTQIINMGWIRNHRPQNCGGIGNTLEDLLGVPENNLQLPDFGAWELKSQRQDTTSLITLFHSEPEPRNLRFVPAILLPNYGWPHQEAGTTYPATERSFRQTISGENYSDRGFRVFVDMENERVYVDLNAEYISDRHEDWLASVRENVGDDISLVNKPYWSFNTLRNKLATKLNNLVFVRAENCTQNGSELYRYNQIDIYMEPSLQNMLQLINEGVLYVDFDARTQHNHGTKFRIRTDRLHALYSVHLEA